MDVSVVICTWNRAELLDQTLTGLRNLRVPAGLSWELLVVNNNCTDDTDAVVGRHADHLPLRLVHEPTPGLSNARNKGIAEATGELLAWTDDDVQADPEWLAEVVAGAARHPTAGGFGGVIEPWFPVEPDPLLLEVFSPLRIGFCGQDLGPTERVLAADEYAYGANMIYRPAVARGLTFDPLLGRNKHFLGGHEDKAYQDQLRGRGGEVVWLPKARVKHWVDPSRMTLGYLKKFYYGVGVSDVRKDGVPVGPRLMGAPRYLYRVAVERYLKFVGAKVRGRRKAALEHLRSYHYHRGLIAGCRQRAKGGPA